MKEFDLEAEVVTVVDLRCNGGDRDKVLKWLYDDMKAVRVVRTGPEIKGYQGTGRFHVIAHLPGEHSGSILKASLKAL